MSTVFFFLVRRLRGSVRCLAENATVTHHGNVAPVLVGQASPGTPIGRAGGSQHVSASFFMVAVLVAFSMVALSKATSN